MAHRFRRATLLAATAVLLAVALPASTIANHSWGGYHWARSANPLQLNLGNATASDWKTSFGIASADWSKSSVLNTSIVPSSVDPRKCRATSGQVNVCSKRYGYNGWLGVARIWADGSHIQQATVKLNDSYFASPIYDTPEWRNVVMCQEIGHAFGLDHQDEVFGNADLGTCMDYSNNPDPNQHPNDHDYEELQKIYEHLDGGSSGGDEPPNKGRGKKPKGQGIDQSAWGRRVAVSNNGHTSVHVLKVGGGKRIVTFVIWA